MRGTGQVRAVEQDPGGRCRAAVAELDRRPGPGEVRRHLRVRQRQRHLVGEGAAALVLARVGGLPGGLDQAAGPQVPVRGQLGRALVRHGGGRHRLPVPGPLGDPLQLLGDPLVRAGRRGGQVPGPPVLLSGPAQRPGERPVSGDPAGERGTPVGGVPDQRVSEAHQFAGEEHQPGPFGRFEVLDARTELPGGLQHRAEAPGVVGGGHQQYQPGGLGQPPDLFQEAVLDPAAQAGGRLGQCQRAQSAGALGGRQGGGQLDQGQRVAPGLLHHAIGDVRGQPGEQFGGGRTVQTLDEQPRQALHGGARGPVADGEEHHDALRAQSARGEGQHVHRRPVDPLGVVDQAEQRPVGGGLRQHGEDREADGEAVPHLVRGEPEHRPQGVGLRRRQAVDEAQDGQEELVEAAVGELHLRLDALHPQHPGAAGLPGGPVEQGGLARRQAQGTVRTRRTGPRPTPAAPGSPSARATGPRSRRRRDWRCGRAPHRSGTAVRRRRPAPAGSPPA